MTASCVLMLGLGGTVMTVKSSLGTINLPAISARLRRSCSPATPDPLPR